MTASAILAFLLAAAPVAHARAPETTRRAFLQINGYYVLYTYPTGPYLSRRGTLMAALPVTLELIGARVEVSPDATSAKVRFLGADYVFTAGSPAFLYNGRRLPLPEPPRRIPGRALLVPLLPLLDTGGVPYEWDHRWRVLRIRDRRLTTRENLLWDLVRHDFPADRFPHDRIVQFVPVRFHTSWFRRFTRPTSLRHPNYEHRFYTEIRHTGELTLRNWDERVFEWYVMTLLKRPGESFLTAWGRRYRRAGMYDPRGGWVYRSGWLGWGNYAPHPGQRPWEPCTPRPGGHYVCYYVSNVTTGLRGWWQFPVFVVAGFVRRE